MAEAKIMMDEVAGKAENGSANDSRSIGRQGDRHGDSNFAHFIGINDLCAADLHAILAKAASYLPEGDTGNGQVDKIAPTDELAGCTVMNLFFENSTRTRTTFELAAKKLGAEVVNLDIAKSSTSKGESLKDTLDNLAAMGADAFVVRHHASGAAKVLARDIAPNVAIINAGDGSHAHPTQAMLDMLTIMRHASAPFAQLKVAIVGDIKHSRVARSDIAALQKLGVVDIRLIAPKTLLPTDIAADGKGWGVRVFHQIEAGLQGVDVVIALRIQNERIGSPLLPSKEEYFARYGITDERLQLADKRAIVLHPGPINREVEIASSVADSAQAVILKQVHYGVAIRMAVMALAVAGQRAQRLRKDTIA